jgi:acyl-CoA synthetase (AMP-forming)/AMP-acid ligase II
MPRTSRESARSVAERPLAVSSSSAAETTAIVSGAGGAGGACGDTGGDTDGNDGGTDGTAVPTVDDLDRLCLDRIARYKRPKDYRFVDSLPTNNYGKVLKRELRDRLRAETS